MMGNTVKYPPAVLTAPTGHGVGRAYTAPNADWIALGSALRAGDPSGGTDDLGDFLRPRPPRGKGGQRT
jgi:hypothetical protein